MMILAFYISLLIVCLGAYLGYMAELRELLRPVQYFLLGGVTVAVACMMFFLISKISL